MITADKLRELLDYDESTGVMVWRSKHNNGRIAGCVRNDGYVVIRVSGVLHYRHRLAWLHKYGAFPINTIDHINTVKGDDRINNLRDIHIQTNSENHRKASSNNKSSGYLGVQRNHNGWQGHITVHGKRHLLGTYKTPEAAHDAYIFAKRRLHKGCTI